MNACVDIGNTLTKVAFFENNDLIKCENVVHEAIPELINKMSPNRVIISTVAKPIINIREQIKPDIDVLTLDNNTPLPVQVQYKDKLGLDRIAGLCGAHHLFPSENVLIIDAGTCLTFDVLDRNNCYGGGRISPGLQMRFKAMHSFTQNLLDFSKDFDASTSHVLLGKSTKDAIISGAYFGIKEEVEGLIIKFKQKFSNLKVIICGGDAKIFDYQDKEDIFVKPELVFIGLNSILFYNASKIC